MMGLKILPLQNGLVLVEKFWSHGLLKAVDLYKLLGSELPSTNSPLHFMNVH
jgi:hypothetical protein